MFNPYFSYDTDWLWKHEAWKDRCCPVYPLFQCMEEQNYESHRIKNGDGPFCGRSDGTYFPKTWSVTYPEVMESLQKQGLRFHCYEMGHVCWIVVEPEKLPGEAPDVVVIQQSVDYEDPNWAMNVMDRYAACNARAAQEKTVLLYSCPQKPDKDNLLSSLIQEYGTLAGISLDHLYLSVENLLEAGGKLNGIPGFSYRDPAGNPADPDSCVESHAGLRVLPIAGLWQNHVSNLWGTAVATRSIHPSFDLERMKHTIIGKKMTQCMLLEHEYDAAGDPRLLAHWEEIGLHYETHMKDGQRWISMVPDCVYGQTEKRLPTMVIFREVSHNNDYLPLIALAGFYDYIDLAAQGEMNLLLFVLEDPDSNDMLADILREAQSFYPMDPGRTYVTGHSHNALYCLEFAARNPGLVAGVATEGSMHCLIDPKKGGPLNLKDESVEALCKADMPVLNCNGTAENLFLIREFGTPDYEMAVEGYQRRLRASGCEELTPEEIRAAHDSQDYATRMLGVPTDRTEVKVLYGTECYFGHVRNKEGKEHLRLVTVDNLPHITNPMFPEISWTFLRRFARDQETGALVELY